MTGTVAEAPGPARKPGGWMTGIKKALRIRPWLPRRLDAVSIFQDRPVTGFFNAALLPPSSRDRIEMLCRTAYYELDSRSFQVGPARPENTCNALLTITLDGAAREVADIASLKELDGLEDIRFFPFNGELFFFAVGIDTTSERILHRPVLGRMRKVGDEFAITTRVATEHVQAVEKNWVFFTRDQRLYIEKFPGMAEVYEVDPATLLLKYSSRGEGSLNWSGTKAMEIGDGNLFIDHRRIYIIRNCKTVQRYVFRFRYIPFSSQREYISRTFSICGPDNLIYVSDMAPSFDGQSILIAASANDNCFEILAVSLKTVMAMVGA